MQKNDQFYSDMQQYIAVTTIGPSTLRNQGAKGVIKTAQKYLAAVSLARFRTQNESGFLCVLDGATEELRFALPQGAQHWGAARKALNLFLRDICYNRFLCARHGLEGSEDWMELPLDSLVAGWLKREARREGKRGWGELPCWPGLNGLESEDSTRFQSFAKRLAEAGGVSRVHLDMRLWTVEREQGGKSVVAFGPHYATNSSEAGRATGYDPVSAD